MEPELVREEKGLVIGVITKTLDDKYEAVMQAKQDGHPMKENIVTREFDRLEDARRWDTGKCHCGSEVMGNLVKRAPGPEGLC